MTIALDRSVTRTLATVILGLAASIVLPLLVHLIPVEAGPPAGARLLPIFFATLVVALRFGAVPALAVAVLSPLLNRLLTGMPAGPMLPTLLIELTAFVVLILVVRHFAPRLAPFVAPLAYLAAATAARALLAPESVSLAALWGTVQIAYLGLAMLLAVGAVAGRNVPRRGTGRSFGAGA
jgi:hypothetical protein